MKHILNCTGRGLFLSLALVFLFSGLLSAGEKKNSSGNVLIWEVTRKDLPGKLYLAGSIHAAPARLYPLDRIYDKVLQESSSVGFEIDAQSMQDLPRVVRQYAFFPPGKKLSSLVSFMDFQKICAFIMKHNQNYTPEILEQIRPWMLYSEIIQMLLRKNSEFKQEYAMERAFLIHKGDRRTFALEDAESQIRGIAQVPDGETVRVVLRSIDRAAKADSELEQFILALKDGNTALLDTIVAELQKKYPSFHKHLFVERNKGMVRKMLPLLRKKETSLILIGAAHFAGEENILQLLRKDSCRIRQLDRMGSTGRITVIKSVKK